MEKKISFVILALCLAIPAFVLTRVFIDSLGVALDKYSSFVALGGIVSFILTFAGWFVVIGIGIKSFKEKNGYSLPLALIAFIGTVAMLGWTAYPFAAATNLFTDVHSLILLNTVGRVTASFLITAIWLGVLRLAIKGFIPDLSNLFGKGIKTQE